MRGTDDRRSMMETIHDGQVKTLNREPVNQLCLEHLKKAKESPGEGLHYLNLILWTMEETEPVTRNKMPTRKQMTLDDLQTLRRKVVQMTEAPPKEAMEYLMKGPKSARVEDGPDPFNLADALKRADSPLEAGRVLADLLVEHAQVDQDDRLKAEEVWI